MARNSIPNFIIILSMLLNVPTKREHWGDWKGAEEIEGLTYSRLDNVLCEWYILEIRSAFLTAVFFLERGAE